MTFVRTSLRTALVAVTVAASGLSAGAPASAVGEATTTRFTLPLSVDGNRIIDGLGHPVALQGLQRDGTEGGPNHSTIAVTSDEISWLTTGHAGSWNANVLRVPVGSAQWTGACPSLANDAAGYRGAIDDEVRSVTATGAVALIDRHASTAGCTAIGGHAMPDAPVTQLFWNDLARHFAANPLVAFELYNEPHFVYDSTWLNGTSGATMQDCDGTAPLAPAGEARVRQAALLTLCRQKAPKYQAVGMQELYDIVTSAAPGHLVVVDGPGYAGAVPGLRVAAHDGHLVYGFHPYTCPIPGSACDTTDGAKANLDVLRAWATLAQDYPVFATELGWPTHPDSTNGTYVDGARYYLETLAFLQQQRPAWGFVAFAFDGCTSGAFSLISDQRAYIPNSTGLPLYEVLRAQP